MKMLCTRRRSTKPEVTEEAQVSPSGNVNSPFVEFVTAVELSANQNILMYNSEGSRKREVPHATV